MVRRARRFFGSRREGRRVVGRGHGPVVGVLAMFAVVSVGSAALSAAATARAQHQAVVVQVAGRQRTLVERYTNDVLLRRAGRPADPAGTALLLAASARALLSGGTAPAADGDDDQARLPAATDRTERAQLAQEQRLISDLTGTGQALLAGTPTAHLPVAAGERGLPVDGELRLRVLAAATSNVGLNAARTIATNADRRVAWLVRLQVLLGAAGLAGSLLLGWLLIAATRRQGAHFRSLVQASTDLVTILNDAHGCAYASPSLVRLTGRSEAQLTGMGIWSSVHIDDLAELQALSGALHIEGTPVRFRLRAADRWRELEATVTDLRGDRHVRGVVLNSRDITERVALEEQLHELAFHDPLTGLPNRALLRDRLEHALAKAAAGGQQVAVLLADLDEFKQVNDTLGHQVGDRLLVSVADRIATAIGPGDTVARLGGDEFAIVLEDTDPRRAATVAARIVAATAEPVLLAGRHLTVGASVGVALSGEPGASGEQLMRHADVAMYAAKHGGRGRVEMFHPALARQSGELLGLQHEIYTGLALGEFTMHYQPEVSLTDGSLRGVEALMRWNSPTRGVVGPAAFIPAAESTSAILALGGFALVNACAHTAQWAAARPLPDGFITWVNISAKQLTAGGLPAIVQAALSAAGLPPQRLGVELTETSLVSDTPTLDHARDQLEELHRLGVHIAVDDFGTGFSSLSHLQRLPVDALKIDRSFIAGIDRHGKDTAIVSNVINLAHALGLVTIAEGVETTEQLDQLRDLHCDLGQGYLFARPNPPDTLAALLIAPTITQQRPGPHLETDPPAASGPIKLAHTITPG